MDTMIQKLEEKLAFMQVELQQMSDELFAQQREISILQAKINHLEDKIKSGDYHHGILRPDEDSPPPHY